MTVTPWGPAEALRERRLRPGPGNQRSAVERNQRERLLGAMVAVVADKGYERTRVADVLEVAGVSRSAFYRHFADRQACFLATLDALAEVARTTVTDAFEGAEGSWDRRLETTFAAYAELIVEQPAAARVAYVEAHAAGPAALARIDRIEAEVAELVRAALAESPAHAGIPGELVRAALAGLRKLIHTRLRERREHELLGLAPQVIAWALSYRSPSEPLPRPRAVPAGLAPEPRRPTDARERILLAMTDLVAERGFAAVRIGAIASRASVSLSTFYKHFGGKEDALLGAIDLARERTLEALSHGYARAGDWPHALAAAVHALFALLASDPSMARLAAIGAYEGPSPVLARRDDAVGSTEVFLAEGYRMRPDTPAIAAECVAATVYALMRDHVLRAGAESLYEVAPTATFVALAPFVGSEAATAVATRAGV